MRILDLAALRGDDGTDRFAAYRSYLESVRASMPPSAFAFAVADWHYDFNDPRSPHDSWVDALSIAEPASGERKQNRSLEINVSLLGAYHNGHIHLRYIGVRSYSLGRTTGDAPAGGGHGDWLIDEVRISKAGAVIHEIQFSRGAAWIIECDDIQYEWRPLGVDSQQQ